jgi:hypothetical protein
MSLTTCAVTFRIFQDDGTPDVGATVSAILNQYEVYNGYIVPDLVTGTTNSSGIAVLNLWPNVLGSTGSVYTFRVIGSNGKKITTTAMVPNQAAVNATDIAGLPAQGSQTDAQYSLAISQTYAGQASGSATAAAASATSAATSAAASAASAASVASAGTVAASTITEITTQANNAAAAATTASNQATTATNQATAASTSATNAATSANTATTQATTATAQASAAATSATNAASSATTATNAATSASTSATTATTKASEASASATSASTSATTATTKAGEASTSATSAAASATAAAASASVAASGGIRFDQSQSLTTGQKTQAQSNIGLAIGTNVQAWDADLDAIAALTGLAGLLKKTAANTWELDTSVYLTGITSGQITTALGFTPYNSTNPSGYLTGITSSQVTTALGFTPYNASNPSGFLTGITSSQVTTALGFTPYNATNPAGYITSSSLTPYAPLAGATFTGAVSATSFTGAHEGTVGATTPSTAKFLHAHSPEITITDGASLAWNTALGQVAKVTLGGSRTFAAPTNLQTGAFYSVFLIQDATGSRTVSWNTVFAFTGGTAPTLSTAANAVDQIAFRYDGTKLREVGRSLGTA